MGKCVICGKDSGNAECCSGACRAKKARRTVDGARAEAHAAQRTVVDVTGQQHEIDFEGRRKDQEILDDWAAGKGTLQQQELGKQARKYSVIKGYLDKGYNRTAQGRQYLG